MLERVCGSCVDSREDDRVGYDRTGWDAERDSQGRGGVEY
jgi:hypothetical protein